MDYIATLLFIVVVVFGGWFYGCKVNSWCGNGTPEGVALNEAIVHAKSNALDADEDVDKNNIDKDNTDVVENTKKEENKKQKEESAIVSCTKYLTKDIRPGGTNDKKEVVKLEKFLNEHEGENLITGGIYDSVDQAAVKRFQKKYAKDILEPAELSTPNGLVLEGTREKINELYCAKKK